MLTNTEVTAFEGDTILDAVVVRNIKTGDVRHNSIKRCASAVGEGAMAVTFVHRYLENG